MMTIDHGLSPEHEAGHTHPAYAVCTTPNNATPSWQDIADLLKPDQVLDLARLELRWDVSDEKDAGLWSLARSFAESNLNARLQFGHLGQPEGAAQVDLGSEVEPGLWIRKFAGAVFDAFEDCVVAITGDQYSDGRIERRLLIRGNDAFDPEVLVELSVSAEEPRYLADALVWMAGEIDRLADGAELAGGAAL